ncbi:phage portal protein, partial [Lactobacillus crispatus]
IITDLIYIIRDGNAYAYRWRNINGVDLRWEFLRPSQVQPYLLSDGSGMYYNVSFDEPEIGTKMYIPQSDMIHIRLASKNGGLTGVSPLKSLKPETQLKSASNKMALRALKQSVMVNGVLKIKHGGLLDWATRASRSRKAKAQIDNSNGGPFVIDDLEDYQPLEVKSNIANLLKQVDWTGSQIAKVYGVPDSFINGQGDQQSSIAQISNQYVKALNRYVTPIVSELNNKLNIHIDKDLRPAIDVLGDNFATTISSLKKDGTLAGNQARYVLQKSGFLPDDLPQPDLTAEMTAKGGDDNGNTGSQGNNRT